MKLKIPFLLFLSFTPFLNATLKKIGAHSKLIQKLKRLSEASYNETDNKPEINKILEIPVCFIARVDVFGFLDEYFKFDTVEDINELMLRLKKERSASKIEWFFFEIEDSGYMDYIKEIEQNGPSQK